MSAPPLVAVERVGPDRFRTVVTVGERVVFQGEEVNGAAIATGCAFLLVDPSPAVASMDPRRIVAVGAAIAEALGAWGHEP